MINLDLERLLSQEKRSIGPRKNGQKTQSTQHLPVRLDIWRRDWTPDSETGRLAARLDTWQRDWTPGSETGHLAARLDTRPRD